MSNVLRKKHKHFSLLADVGKKGLFNWGAEKKRKHYRKGTRQEHILRGNRNHPFTGEPRSPKQEGVGKGRKKKKR